MFLRRLQMVCDGSHANVEWRHTELSPTSSDTIRTLINFLAKAALLDHDAACSVMVVMCL